MILPFFYLINRPGWLMMIFNKGKTISPKDGFNKRRINLMQCRVRLVL